jgi:Amt family ammonium transporter
MFIEWKMTGKPSVIGAVSGAVAGLVAITPASGFVTPMPALLIGAAAGVVCYMMVSKVKRKFGYDDALDAFGVHGVGGTLGAVLTGVFATKAVNDLRAGKPMGLVDGDAGQVLNQVVAVVIAVALATVGTLIIMKVCDQSGDRGPGPEHARRRRIQPGKLTRPLRRQAGIWRATARHSLEGWSACLRAADWRI